MKERMEKSKLTVHVKFGQAKAHFDGTPNEVTIAFLNFVNQIYPQLELVEALVFRPDIVSLSKALTGVIQYSPDGLILVSNDLSSTEVIVLCLLGAYVGNQLGFLVEDTLSVNEIANASGRATKTILNQFKSLISDGFVTRVERGKYKIKSLGIKRGQELLQRLNGRNHP